MKSFLIILGICISVVLMSHRSTSSFRPEAKEKAELKSFGKPDEVREFPKGKVELIKIGGATIGRATFQPGWKWSESVQPLVKTNSCEAPHYQYHVSGVLMVKMDDGTLLECKPGDVSLLPVGHDAWVVGSEPAVVVDFQGMVDYAKSN
ncbi:MAG TPA: cupin domain-containing protein [Saprospiraceae bacterium]|nr:cupin domain-containing protein [Saprospiraceae bacterium]